MAGEEPVEAWEINWEIDQLDEELKRISGSLQRDPDTKQRYKVAFEQRQKLLARLRHQRFMASLYGPGISHWLDR